MRPLALLAAAVLVGCASDAPPADAPEVEDVAVAEAPDPAPAPSTPDAEAPAADDAAYRIVSADAGDRACYLELEPAGGGAAESVFADFEVCYEIEDDGLTGRLVTLATEPTPILAESCEGDVDCPDRDVVDLVMAITLVD